MQKAVRIFCSIFIVLASVSSVFAQVRVSIPVRITDGTDTDTLFFGVRPGANYCILEADTINNHGEFFYPPVPPGGIFDTRLVWPRTGSNLVCFDQGSPCDFRPYTATAQKDTFRIKTQPGATTTVVLSWPAGLASVFTGLTLRYFDQNLGQNVNIDMLTATSVDVTEAGDPATTTIYSAGLTGTGVGEGPTGVPTEFALGQNYPNPFNPTTTIEFSVVQTAMTDISVFDVLGRKVATLAAEVLSPGFKKVTWDGKNSVGNGVASGVYFVRMNARAENGVSFTAMRKLLLMK